MISKNTWSSNIVGLSLQHAPYKHVEKAFLNGRLRPIFSFESHSIDFLFTIALSTPTGVVSAVKNFISITFREVDFNKMDSWDLQCIIFTIILSDL